MIIASNTAVFGRLHRQLYRYKCDENVNGPLYALRSRFVRLLSKTSACTLAIKVALFRATLV